MSIIYFLIPIAIIFILIAIGVFFWAVRSDQFKDLERHGHSILFDDDLKNKSLQNKSLQNKSPQNKSPDKSPLQNKQEDVTTSQNDKV